MDIDARSAQPRDMGGHRRMVGLRRRAPLYVGVAVVSVVAGGQLGSADTPHPLLFLGLASAYALGQALPAQGPIGIWRARSAFPYPAVVCCALLLAWPWAVAAWALGAIASGCYVRRYRTTPGRMATGASMVTLAGAAATLVGGALHGHSSTVAETLVAAACASLVYRVVLSICWQQAHGDWMGRSWRSAAAELVRLDLATLFAVTAGSTLGTAAVVLADGTPWMLLLLACPYVGLVLGAAHGALVQRERDRMETLILLGRRLHRATDVDGVLEELNSALVGILGCPSVELRDAPPLRGEAGARLSSGGWLVAGARYGPPSYLGLYTRDEQRLLRVVAAAATAALETVQIVAHHRELSTRDPLTGLPNRRAFDQELDRVIAATRRSGAGVGLLFLDLDLFKHINDSFGHEIGDEVLRAAAQRLRTTARAHEFVARWGGEEFVAILPGTTADALRRAGERFRVAIEQCSVIVTGDKSIFITASIGGAALEEGGQASDLLVAADRALLEAKEAGRNRVKVSRAAPAVVGANAVPGPVTPLCR
jgi:diguanylate cyclase (GGDEF)-like protein